MRARNVPFGSMFGWIPATFRLVSGNFGAMAVATILTLLFGLLMAAPMFGWMIHSLKGLGSPGVPQPQEMTGFWITYAITIVVGIVLGPPLLAGWFRLCRDADRGAAVSGAQVLAPYTDAALWPRVLVFVLLGTLMYAAVFGLLFLVFGGAFTGLMAMQAANEAALRAGQSPPPPDMALLAQMMLMYVVMLPTLFVLQFVYMVGLAEVSLRPTSPVAAFTEAFKGVLRNVFKLLLLLFIVGAIAGVVMTILVLVFGLLAMGLAFISPILAMIVMGLVYVALLMVMYPMMFAGNYFVWKDMVGDDPPQAIDPGSVAA